MNILVVAAHPDDEVLGCGGTIARLSSEGEDVRAVILGEGITSRYPRRQMANAADIRSLKRDARTANKILGVKKVDFFDLPDNRFDQVPFLDIVKRVERMIEGYRPVKVFTHHSGDLNIDHALTQRAVVTATRPSVASFVREVYAFEVPSATEWAFGQGQNFIPDTFVNIETTLEKKILAMKAYRNEARKFPHPRSPESLRALASVRGSTSGLRAAEAFSVIRLIV